MTMRATPLARRRSREEIRNPRLQRSFKAVDDQVAIKQKGVLFASTCNS